MLCGANCPRDHQRALFPPTLDLESSFGSQQVANMKRGSMQLHMILATSLNLVLLRRQCARPPSHFAPGSLSPQCIVILDPNTIRPGGSAVIILRFSISSKPDRRGDDLPTRSTNTAQDRSMTTITALIVVHRGPSAYGNGGSRVLGSRQGPGIRSLVLITRTRGLALKWQARDSAWAFQ